MVFYKLRTGAYQQSGSPIKVLTVPNDIAVFYEQTYFKVEHSGTSIIFTSGTKQVFADDKLENYNYEDCRV